MQFYILIMSKESKVIKRREIKQRGIFDIETLYKELQSKIKEMSYHFTEKEQTAKTTSKGKDHTIIFLAERKFDDFVKFHIKMEFWFENLNKIKSDNKILDKGELKVIFSSWLEMDYKNKWNQNAVSSFIFNIYTRYVIKEKIEDYYEDKLIEDSNSLYNLIKEKLNLI